MTPKALPQLLWKCWEVLHPVDYAATWGTILRRRKWWVQVATQQEFSPMMRCFSTEKLAKQQFKYKSSDI